MFLSIVKCTYTLSIQSFFFLSSYCVMTNCITHVQCIINIYTAVFLSNLPRYVHLMDMI